jgi:D-alanine---D-serine ligase
MNKKKIAIIFGGCSSEYEVSLQSAYSIINAMSTSKYERILIGITKQGDWYRYYGSLEKIKQDTWYEDTASCLPTALAASRSIHGFYEFEGDTFTTTKVDAIFPVIHGKNGEDGTLQGLIELAGIPIIGCGMLASALAMDKNIAHKLVTLAGIKTPKASVFKKNVPLSELMAFAETLSYPIFVKPLKAGSSFGITKVKTKEELGQAITHARFYDDEIILEENIDGFEVGCAVLGNDSLTVGKVDEIELTDGFFDYTEKYTLKSSKIHMPARLNDVLTSQIQEAAIKIYRTLNCKGFARVDLFVTKNEELVFNEVNTIPGFTVNSRYPNMMKGIGLQFSEIIDHLVHLGLEK